MSRQVDKERALLHCVFGCSVTHRQVVANPYISEGGGFKDRLLMVTLMPNSNQDTWSVAEGRQKFSRLVKSASLAPQTGRFDDLARLCDEEDYALELSPRSDRPSPFGP